MAYKVTNLDAIVSQSLIAKTSAAALCQGIEQLSGSRRCRSAAVEFVPVGITTVLAQRAIPKAQLTLQCRIDIFALNLPGLVFFGAEYKDTAIGLAWGKSSKAHLVPLPCLACDVLTLQRSGTIALDHRISWEHNYINALQMLGKAA